MNGVYAYSSDVWPPLAAALFVAALGLYTWQRRDVPAGKPFLAASAFGSLLLLSIALETAAVVPEVRVIWYQWQYAVQMLAVTAGTSISLEYAYPGRWLTRRNLTLFAVPPLLTITAIIFAPQLIWQQVWVGPNNTVVAVYTPLGLLPAAYSWSLLIVNAAAFLWLFARSPQHRWPVALMLSGQIIGRVLILIDIASMPRLMGADLTVIVVLAPWAAYAVALLGFHILDPLPAAQQTALAQMSEGMIVLDTGGRVASVNPAASAMLALPVGRARGRLLGELLPGSIALPAWNEACAAGKAPDPAEINFGSSGGHWYAVECSPLCGSRGQRVGSLLMLRDITEQKRARAQILEQERALATLRERERLARELHDGVTQLLAAAHLQANTAKQFHTRGQDTQLLSCLDALAATTLQAEVDLREYLLGVKSTHSGARPLFATVREYLVQFTRLYGVPVAMTVSPAVEAEGLPPLVEVQLVRIIQEALTNVRKHACRKPPARGGLRQGDTPAPCRAWITFAFAGAYVRVVIADDGCGCDPTVGARASSYGLRAMEERAQAVAGSLTVTSSPGHGTQVTVMMPRAASSEALSIGVSGNEVQTADAGNGVAS